MLRLRALVTIPSLVLLVTGAIAPALAQENAAEEAVRKKAALTSLSKDAARRVFGTATTPAPAAPSGDTIIVGEYWKGCYTGGLQLPADGEHWQVMRLSRNRNWGHPALISFLETFTHKAAEATGWPGILIGDMSQPRGGPMLTGHSSHQLGIELDIWLRPMGKKRLTKEEREEVRSTDLLRRDRKDVDPKVYTQQHMALLRTAAQQPEVARVFVNAAIKKALCRDAGKDRGWLTKIRPAAGHNYHFHIRLKCPKGQTGCHDQTPPGPGDGCGKELDSWLRGSLADPKPGPPSKGMSMTSMPAACRALFSEPSKVKP